MRKFKKFYIEITNVCNLACSFCPVTGREAEFMKIDDFHKILDQIKPYAEFLYFHVKGEPLLHPELDKFLDISYQKGFKVNITTNGTLISKVKDLLLDKPSLRQINISLHSFDGNQNMNHKAAYMENIISFIKEARKKTNIIISLRLWNLERDNQINLTNNKNREILTVLEQEFNLPYQIQDVVISARGIKLGERLYLNQDHEFTWPGLGEPEDEGIGFCHGLRNQAAILVDGTVIPCCLDGEGIIELGNIHETEFSKIIESNRAAALYNGFTNRQAVEELCRKCGYRKKFGTR
ncbi:radical SAM protein [Anaerocolumna sp. AGMB13025]|uniref:radical SAM/SPASM domain-containing protein n=1 Tax=Anaerocolumna sp. AGMB13025 TaxID=3039116 RepID=UPI00241EDA23|nr:radical SAM protein [Anaerocolumna sp. AGMB13025]WFR55443.1 radical SAM protein [Anaerocolumna sp. AGMB13025]